MDIDILDKFSTNLKEVLTRALEQTILSDQKNVEPLTLLDSLSQQKGSVAHEVLQKNGFRMLAKKKNISSESTGSTATKTKNLTPILSLASKRAIEKAVLAANLFSHTYVGTEHMLFGLLEIDNKQIIAELRRQNVDIRKLRSQTEGILKASSKFNELSERDDLPLASPPTPGNLGGPDIYEEDIVMGPPTKFTHKSKTPTLDFFSVDLTSPEIQSKIDPLIGRQNEVQRMMQILCRRHKNNPLLLGEPGVGKTAIVEGLAKRILTGEVPDELANKKILALDLSLIIAGTMYRGEFEARLKQVIEEIRNNPNLIVFIDEVHNIIGAGSTAGSLDAANILKPALARGELHCIGATTLDEFKKHIESDPALERRFQAIQIKEPGRDETIKILKGIKPNYEKFHNIIISNQSLETAVDVSIRYLTDKFLPDKAIDLIDEAASGMKINLPANPRAGKLRELEQELANIQDLKQRAVMNERYREAVELKSREKECEKTIADAKKNLATGNDSIGTLRESHILEVISRQIGVPVNEIELGNGKNFLSMIKRINQSIIGQDHIIEEVVKTISRSKTGFSDPNRPLASFLFVGPSGVGKTELARVLARELYPQENALVQIDMSEFKESYSASKLLGSPAGYVGYKERNKFTDEVRKKPYAVVLFDEFEKAHPDVQNLLLQILDQGAITDATGRKINFKNAIIVLTTNLGQDTLKHGIGFGPTVNNPEVAKNFEEKLKEHFRPELLNRLDAVLYFNMIGRASLEKIIINELNFIVNKAKNRGFGLSFHPSSHTAILKKCLENDHGARSVKKMLLNWVESPLSEMILNGKINKGNSLEIAYNKGKFYFTKKDKPKNR